jgi:hypothetical protein
MLDTSLRVDWFSIFDDLKRQGFSLYEVEMRISVPKATLHGWKSGAEPKYCEGERLLWLWSEVTRRPRESAPKISRYSHRA